MPTVFYYKPSKDSVTQDATIYLAQYGNEPVPAYTLRHPDPASADSRNRYAAALYDCYNPEILFGEVLLIPQWAQAGASQEDGRRNGGVPPKPEPTLPSSCTIQLYNPDLQVVLQHTPSKWNASEAWDFELPQQTFRQPSASALDRGQNDPAVLEATPTVPLRWKREGKLSKDLMCFMAGRQRNPDGSKRKHKEPDIPLAYFRNLREITIYEPNLSRVDVEDPKGFEVTLLLAATIIRDVYHGTLRQAFNIAETPLHQPSAESKPAYQPPPVSTLSKPPSHSGPSQSTSTGKPGIYPSAASASANTNAPPTDPRSQWEIDAETARLAAELAAERKAEAKARKRGERKSEKAAQKFAEEEQRAARARQAAIDAETARLREAWARETSRLSSPPLPPLPPRSGGAASPQLPARPGDNINSKQKKKKHQPSTSASNNAFLQAPPSGPNWMAGASGPVRPASATGFAPGAGYGPTGPGGPGWTAYSTTGGPPSLAGGQGGGLRPVQPVPPQKQSGHQGLFGSLFGGAGRGRGNGNGQGGRSRALSDDSEHRLVNKRSALF